MATPPFHYQHMFPLGPDKTEYYLLTKDYVSVSEFEGKPSGNSANLLSQA